MLEAVQETVVVPDMHTRKRLMFERADAFVALPGGIGTLEELVEQMTWSQLGRHTKPILLLSLNGFWKPLLVLLAHMREQGFIRPGLELSYLVAERVEEVIPMLQAATRRTGITADAGPHRGAVLSLRAVLATGRPCGANVRAPGAQSNIEDAVMTFRIALALGAAVADRPPALAQFAQEPEAEPEAVEEEPSAAAPREAAAAAAPATSVVVANATANAVTALALTGDGDTATLPKALPPRGPGDHAAAEAVGLHGRHPGDPGGRRLRQHPAPSTSARSARSGSRSRAAPIGEKPS